MKHQKIKDNLEELADEALKDVEDFNSKALLPGERKTKRERGQEISIEMGHFVSGLQQRNEEDYIKQWENILMWFVNHPNEMYLIKYYINPDTIKIIPYSSMKWSYDRFKSCGELKEIIDDLRKARYEENGLSSVWNSNMCKFLMVNHFRDDYKSERTEQSIDLSTNNLRYKFDDQSLNIDLGIENEEPTDEV